MTDRFDAGATLAALTDFQRATVHHVMDRYFGNDPIRRFLVADETGLGKSLVARGVIASLIERLQDDDGVGRIDIVYVCSNADIAEQNVTRLNVTGEEHLPFASRLTLLARESHRLNGRAATGLKPVNLVSFTPGTSFEKGHGGGRVEERALLFVLLRELMHLDKKQQRRARVVLSLGVKPEHFNYQIDWLDRHTARHGGLDHLIVDDFAADPRTPDLIDRFAAVCDAIGQRRKVRPEEHHTNRDLVSDLRSTLAKASVGCLEPDLIVLDEFQRFRHLLDRETGGPSAELAHDLFDYSDARVLLLSATPYKPFTYAEEQVGRDGDDHQRDFLATLRFLAAGDTDAVAEIAAQFAALRAAAVSGSDPTSLTDHLRHSLLRLMCRTERPLIGFPNMLDEVSLATDDIGPVDIVDLAALRSLARRLDAPFAIEYWKSVPYFVNFSDGYKLGIALRDALLDPEPPAPVKALVASTRQIRRSDVDSGAAFDPGNARLRTLVRDTVDNGWWRLLWVPPSLPYLQPAGPFAEPEVEDMTKRLIFSSWAATPTAIATIVSHHAQRFTATSQDGEHGGRRRARLTFRVTDDRPAAMTTLALFWPNPALARLTDPLAAAQDHPTQPRSPEDVVDEARRALAPLVGADGTARGTVADAWYWLAAFRLRGAVPEALVDDPHHLTLSLAGELPSVLRDEADESDRPDSRLLQFHVDLALDAADVPPPDQRPDDLVESVARIGLHGPGNAAWRALRRQLDDASTVTPEGLWSAAATIASGFRSLFNRPDVAALLDSLYPDTTYWRAVLAYCTDGNLQAMLDEYIHHLAGTRGPDPLNDRSILDLATRVHDALAMRPAPYTAFDPSSPEDPITFSARFCLRYGNRRQTEGEARQPLVRNAFNSPFWPFVLATTSVGQEGIDLHWWCHAVMHWNTPASPVDFDQREGRVHRYGGHAIRKNVAARHRQQMLTDGAPDPWTAGYAAATELRNDLGDITPHWVYPGPASITRIVAPYPLSIDHDRLRRLKDDVALYRLTMGQPRQEDLLNVLWRQGIQTDEHQAAKLLIDLTPPRALEEPAPRERGDAGFDSRAYIDSVTWTFAKTMPEHPHWYTVRRRVDQLPDDAPADTAFDQMVSHIRTHGRTEPWRPAPDAPARLYTYLNIDDYDYWTLGAPIPVTTIINRRRISPSTE